VSSAIPGRRKLLEPPGRWPSLRPGELWHYRELLYILAWRDVMVRYKQAVLGVAWAVLQPLVMMGIFTLLFDRIASVPTGDVPYPIFVLVGLVPWTLFSNATARSGASLVSDQTLISRVYFPRLVIPAGAALAWIPDFIISSVILLVMMGLFGFAPPLTVVLLPLVMVAALLAALSVGVWLAALNVAYRDVQHVVPFLLLVWLFLTPVAFPATSVPPSLSWLAGLNPMAWVIDLSRWSMTGAAPALAIDILSLVVTVSLMVSGLYYFRRVEHFFADVI